MAGLCRAIKGLRSTIFRSFSSLAETVRIVEVGPRDGLQNEKALIPTDKKVKLVDLLSDCGFSSIEVTSFVSPKRVPQLADANQVLQQIQKKPGVRYSVLTPNEKGYQNAVQAGAKEIAIFTSASEVFNQKNLNCSIDESLSKFDQIVIAAKEADIRVRGYVSVAVGCPYSGTVNPQFAAEVANELYRKGCYEVSMGDTTGVGTPLEVLNMLEACKKYIPTDKLAVHMHDTYGQAIANINASLCAGISIVDASIAGLGGCPFAPGAAGNASTEDVYYLCRGLGIKTGLDIDALLRANKFVTEDLGLKNMSRAAAALQLKH